MARILVNPRIGVEAKRAPTGSTGPNARDMRDILGWFDQMVWDTVQKKYFPAQRSDLPG